MTYLSYLVMLAVQHPFKEPFEKLMVWGIVPITIALITYKFIRDYRTEKFR